MGGRAADTLLGGAGDDVLYAGAGIDRVHGASEGDRAFTQTGDAVSGVGAEVRVELTDVGGFIRVDGSPDFVARVQSDLDALRSSPRGAAMLAALESSHTDSGLFRTSNGLVIRETDAANGFARPPFVGLGNASIGFNPAFDDLHLSPPVPPIVVLYHELAHVYDYFHDTLAAGTYEGADNPGVPNAEREAVGLPIDHDGDPDTPDTLDPDHPYELTENGLRDEFGLNLRQRY
jgi:Ca2+-binding RTX toxin-like protein